MATVSYILKSKNDLSQIYIRLIDGRKTDITVSTGYSINPEFWTVINKNTKDKAELGKGRIRQTSKNNDKLNIAIKLNELQLKVLSCLQNDKDNDTLINKDWLELVIKKYKNPLLDKKTENIIDFIKLYQEELKLKTHPKTGNKISTGTIRNYNTTIQRIEKFEAYKRKQYLIHEIDLTFHTEYNKYATNILSLSINSIGKDFKQIKTVCLDARDKGYSINKQVESRKFNAPTEATLFITLNESELDRIKEFKGQDYLENARDWLIIGCWTGCRISDLMQLTNNNILATTKGQKFIRYTQSKTNKQVDIPIHKDVQSILDRLGNFPRPISNQKFNDWIKLVCKSDDVKLNEVVYSSKQNKETNLKEVGYFEKWELVRSHICRRSFATNHYDKLPNKIIMAVTGHATETMLLNYIGETKKEHLDDFLSVWSEDEKSKKVEKITKELKERKL